MKMTLTAPAWAVWGFTAFAVWGFSDLLVKTWNATVMRAWGWWQEDRVGPLLEDDEYVVEEGELEPLPPERSREDLGFTRVDLATLRVTQERVMPWYEVQNRAAYESMGFDYPSGLMARVRELTP